MKKLHYYREVDRFEIPFEVSPAKSPVQDLLSFLMEVYHWAESKPLIYLNKADEDQRIYLLFPSIAFDPDNFWDDFSDYLTCLEDYFELEIYSSGLHSPDDFYMEIEREEGTSYRVYYSVSGKLPELLDSVSIGIQLNPEDVKNLLLILESLNWEDEIIALKGGNDALFKNYGLEYQSDRSYFSYAWLQMKPEDGYLLHALNFNQKIELWENFLHFQMDYLEFEWLLEKLLDNTLFNRVEWEFALYQASRI